MQRYKDNSGNEWYDKPRKNSFGLVKAQSPISLAEPETGKMDWRKEKLPKGNITEPYIRAKSDMLVIFTGNGSSRPGNGFQQCIIDGSDQLYWIHLVYVENVF